MDAPEAVRIAMQTVFTQKGKKQRRKEKNCPSSTNTRSQFSNFFQAD